eukprot:1140171-Pelagomonas_calceolata.AAC.3
MTSSQRTAEERLKRLITAVRLFKDFSSRSLAARNMLYCFEVCKLRRKYKDLFIDLIKPLHT